MVTIYTTLGQEEPSPREITALFSVDRRKREGSFSALEPEWLSTVLLLIPAAVTCNDLINFFNNKIILIRENIQHDTDSVQGTLTSRLSGVWFDGIWFDLIWFDVVVAGNLVTWWRAWDFVLEERLDLPTARVWSGKNTQCEEHWGTNSNHNTFFLIGLLNQYPNSRLSA